MKFSENLQKLRKKKNISQEQLAEELGVTRQSVSKWESGASYPDMERLSQICSLFHQDLDTLVNGNVDETVDHSTTKNVVADFCKEFGRQVEKTIHLFETKSASEIIRILAQIVLIIIVIALLKIPFAMIEGVIYNVFAATDNFISNFIADTWSFLINLAYSIFAIIGFFYVFKIKFLDKEEVITFSNDGKGEQERTIKEKTVVKTKVVHKSERTFLDFLATLLIWFLKFWAFIFAFPVIIATISMIVVFALLIVLIFEGLFLIGPILASFAAVLLGITILEVIYNFLFNVTTKTKRIFINIITSFILGGVGIALSIWFVSNLTVINEVPSTIKKSSISTEFMMKDDFKIHHFYTDIEYVEDNSLQDKVIVELEYYYNLEKPELTNDTYGISISYNNAERIEGKVIVDDIIYNLKNKEIYNYNKLSERKITVISSSENINKIKSNQETY